MHSNNIEQQIKFGKAQKAERKFLNNRIVALFCNKVSNTPNVLPKNINLKQITTMYFNKKKVQLVLFLLIGWMTLLLIGCNSNIQDGNILSSDDFFEYKLDDDSVLKVILDSEYLHESRTFITKEDFVHYSATLEQVGEVTLNPALWNELAHYFDPIEVSLLDMDRSIVIEGRQYVASSTSLYSRDVAIKGAEYRLEVYYGEDGEDDSREIALIHSHRLNLEELASYNFKDPFAKARYQEFMNLQTTQRNVDGAPLMKSLNSRPSCGSNCDYRVYAWKNSNGEDYEITYRGSSSGPVLSANMRWYIWNESYNKGIIGTKRRSRGGTITEINRLNDGYGWRTMPDDDSKIGPYHGNGTLDRSTPKTYVHVIPVGRSGQTKQEPKWQVYLTDIGRDKNKGTNSRHSAWVRYNNSNNATQVMFNEFVD